MIERQLSVAEVRAALGLSRTTLWRMVRDGRIQPPRRLSAARVAWPQSEIEEFLANCQRSQRGGAQ